MRLWRRSLQLRVVTTTTVLTLITILVLGNVLVTRVRDGLLEAKRDAVLAASTSGARTAQQQVSSADRGQGISTYDTLLPDLVRQLGRGLDGAGSKDVVLLRAPDVPTDAPLGRSTLGADVQAVPPHGRNTFEALAELLARHRGDRRVYLELDVRGQKRPLRVKADVAQRVKPSEKLVAEVEQLCGAGSVELR